MQLLVNEPPSKEELHRRVLELVDVERLEGPELCNAYIQASRLVRYSEPKLMVDLAAHAVDMAKGLDVERYGVQGVADCRCRTLIELGNAYRVADRLEEAGSALGEATALWYEGSRDELLKARLFDYQASLHADRRQFSEAFEALDTVRATYLRLGSVHLAGRALVSKGIYRGYEEAIRLLREGLKEIDPALDPNLHFAAVQSQAYFLAVLGRVRDSRKLLWRHHFPADVVQARTNRLKLRWVEALIEMGLGDEARAEEWLLEVVRGFEKEELHYKAALAGLDLVHLWYRQGRKKEVQEFVTQLLKTFRTYNINREALVAMSLLETALQEGVQAGAILDRVTLFIRRAETLPGLKFEDWF
jgi:tetratricopeptide (TPR) repeat protein